MSDQNQDSIVYYDSCDSITDACQACLEFVLPRHKIESDLKYYLCRVAERQSNESEESSTDSLSTSSLPIQLSSVTLKTAVDVLNQFDKSREWKFETIVANAKRRSQLVLPEPERVRVSDTP
jgi:hypothetical protein